VESGKGFMVVKIRFGRGPVVRRRQGKNSGIAKLSASLLTMVSVSLASLSVWRICTDLGLAGDFVFADGFLSHWQVWMGAAAAVQYLVWRLTRYARAPEPEEALVAAAAPADAETAIANVRV
jgi:hypothetical protein